MDPKLKTVLAVAIGVVIGMTLLGGAVAIPAAFHAMAFRASATDEVGYGMMGRQGMMGGRGQGPQRGDGAGACPNNGAGNADGTSGTCPNGADPSACPGFLEAPTTES